MKRAFHFLVVMAAMLPWCATNSAEPLGRLFFTPAQRNTLDAGKQLAKPRQAAPSGPRAAMLNGVVTRSDGESTIWVDGHSVNRTRSPNAAASHSDPVAARVELQGAGGRVKLKVGQRFDRSTGKVQESYESAPVVDKQSASDTTTQKSVDRPLGRSRSRSRTTGPSDQDSGGPTDD